MRQPLGGWENGLSPETINNFRQNSPELVIRDAKEMLGLDDDQCNVLKNILLARGINKWLKARLDIIKLKNDIKDEIVELQKIYQKWNPAHKQTMRILTRVRSDIRAICHQNRWVEWANIASAEKARKRGFIIRGKRS